MKGPISIWLMGIYSPGEAANEKPPFTGGFFVV